MYITACVHSLTCDILISPVSIYVLHCPLCHILISRPYTVTLRWCIDYEGILIVLYPSLIDNLTYVMLNCVLCPISDLSVCTDCIILNCEIACSLITDIEAPVSITCNGSNV